MAELRPCPSCARHVRSSDTTCPFCDAVVPAAETTTSTPVGRLGRAALFVAGTAIVAASAVGCGPDKPQPQPPPNNPNLNKPYGAPPADPIFV